MSVGEMVSSVTRGGRATPAVLAPTVAGKSRRRSGSGSRSAVSTLVTHPAVSTVAGLVIIVALWWLVAIVKSGVDALPTPPQVLRAAWDFRQELWIQSGQTVGEAAIGFVAGNVIGVALAVGFVQIAAAEKAVLQLAVVTHCLPVVAIGPLLELLLTGKEPRYVMSALLVFFPTVVTVQVGLRRTDRVALEIVRAYGGGGWKQMRHVRLMNSLPYVMTAFKITAPLALLGAILGEFMGGSGGLGVLILSSQQAGLLARTWGVALACTLWSIASFGLFAGATRLLVPWAPRPRSRR